MRSLALVLFLVPPGASRAAPVAVTTPAELANAIAAAAPGDTITLAAGAYDFSSQLSCSTAGTPAAPIVVRASQPGEAIVRLNSPAPSALFLVSAPHWHFENLAVQGICASDADCEHAFQLVGDADFTELRDSVIRDFNVPVRGNGLGSAFPDDVVVTGVELRATAARSTSGPVTMIDAIGGRRWSVRNNVIADFGKVGFDQISYGVVLRGNSRDGRIEQNVVICEEAHTEGLRIGLSLGGGGTAPDVLCEGGTCTPEHQNGLVLNNIVTGCPDDVGIYLNEAAGAGVYHNTLIGSSGIDVRFPASVVDLRNNLLSGTIRARDGALITTSSNLTGVTLTDFEAWFTDPDALDFSLVDGSLFVDQGEVLAAAPQDLCANARNDGSPDLGAVEYDAELGLCGPITVSAPPVPSLRGWGVGLLALLLLGSVALMRSGAWGRADAG